MQIMQSRQGGADHMIRAANVRTTLWPCMGHTQESEGRVDHEIVDSVRAGIVAGNGVLVGGED